MNNRLILVAVVLLSCGRGFGAQPVQYTYEESDGAAQHLNRVTCLTEGGESRCRLQVLTVRDATAKVVAFRCSVISDEVMKWEKSTNTGKGIYSVTLGGGACGITNTYVFSPSGMTQTKAYPASPPAGCPSGAPVTYTNRPAQKDVTQGSIKGCEKITLFIAP